MTGTILRVGPKRLYCFIEAEDGTERYANRNDFLDPSIMKRGQLVVFTPRMARVPGKPLPVTDVIAA